MKNHSDTNKVNLDSRNMLQRILIISSTSHFKLSILVEHWESGEKDFGLDLMIVFTKIHDGQVSDERRIIAFKDLYLPSHELLVTFRKQLAKIVDDFIKLVFFFWNEIGNFVCEVFRAKCIRTRYFPAFP